MGGVSYDGGSGRRREEVEVAVEEGEEGGRDGELGVGGGEGKEEEDGEEEVERGGVEGRGGDEGGGGGGGGGGEGGVDMIREGISLGTVNKRERKGSSRREKVVKVRRDREVEWTVYFLMKKWSGVGGGAKSEGIEMEGGRVGYRTKLEECGSKRSKKWKKKHTRRSSYKTAGRAMEG